MIKQINRNELIGSLYELVGEVEYGNNFNKDDKNYVERLDKVLNSHFNNGCEVFGYYGSSSEVLSGYIMVKYKKGLQGQYYNEYEILEIGVVKELTGKGIGSELMKFVEDYYKDDDLYQAMVKTYAGDYEVIHFYGKNGYTPISVIPGTNGPNDEGTIVMRKLLLKR